MERAIIPEIPAEKPHIAIAGASGRIGSRPRISPERQWTRQVIREYREQQNPTPTADIDVVWTISGYGVYDPRLSPDFVSGMPNFEQSMFANEETELVNLGIDLVYEITALRLNKNKSAVTKEDVKESGPVLLYNGRLDQNDNLARASQSEDFPLPANKLRIEKLADDFEPKNNNTHVQFQKFPHDLLQDTKKIAIVSHLWHVSRTAREPNAPNIVAAEPLWEQVRILNFVADDLDGQRKRQPNIYKRAVEIRRKVMGEGTRIHVYSQKGDLNTERK